MERKKEPRRVIDCRKQLREGFRVHLGLLLYLATSAPSVLDEDSRHSSDSSDSGGDARPSIPRVSRQRIPREATGNPSVFHPSESAPIREDARDCSSNSR